ncbi:hypothetical protein ACLOJK_023096 [Asimina triloba]
MEADLKGCCCRRMMEVLIRRCLVMPTVANEDEASDAGLADLKSVIDFSGSPGDTAVDTRCCCLLAGEDEVSSLVATTWVEFLSMMGDETAGSKSGRRRRSFHWCCRSIIASRRFHRQP